MDRNSAFLAVFLQESAKIVTKTDTIISDLNDYAETEIYTIGNAAFSDYLISFSLYYSFGDKSAM